MMRAGASLLRLRTPLASSVDACWSADMASGAQAVGDIQQTRHFIHMTYAVFDQTVVGDNVGLERRPV